MNAKRAIPRPTINDLGELCEAVGVESFERLKKAVYKGTDCGAWVAAEAGMIVIGSIVEGADVETEIQMIAYPFTLGDFWAAVDRVEIEAAEIWDATHGCEDCGLADDWSNPINPECKTCHGEGAII